MKEKEWYEFAAFYYTKYGKISKRKVRAKLVWDAAKDSKTPTFLPAKLYITAANKRGEVMYVGECRGVRWIDNINSIDRLEEAKIKFPKYIYQIRNGYYNDSYKTPYNYKIARLINHTKHFQGLKL
jgi:hypothetical protein